MCGLSYCVTSAHKNLHCYYPMHIHKQRRVWSKGSHFLVPMHEIMYYIIITLLLDEHVLYKRGVPWAKMVLAIFFDK